MNFFTKMGEKQKTFVVLISLVVILFLAEQFIPWKIFVPIQKVLLPVQISLNKTKGDFKNFVSTLTDIKTLRESEAETSRENALLLAENARLQKLQEENKTLREQLGVKDTKKPLILSSVIGQDPLFSTSRIIIDKGASDGIKKEALVFLKDILIGQISDIGEYSSTVRLLTDFGIKIPAVTQKGVKGLLQGEFGSRMFLTKVIQTKELSEGEIVFSSGEAGYPKGMVIGIITKVEKDPAALFQKAQISPLIDYDSLEILFVEAQEKNE